MHGISVIIPFLNESETIDLYCKTMDEYCKNLQFPIELVFVDDGSTDDSVDKIQQTNFKYINKVKIIKLSKNFGSHAAIRAGISQCYFDISTWMGCDLQDPLEFLKIGYDKILEGYDAVYFEKKTIKVSLIERLFSKSYCWLMCKFAVKNYSHGGTAAIMFNEKIKKVINEHIESNSAINLQIMDLGFKYTYISLNYKERVAGKSKWTFSKKIKLFIDSFVAFSFMPIRAVSIIGIIMFILGILLGGSIFINKILNPLSPIPGYPSLACLISVGFGITNISLGIIAEYLWRTYDFSRNRPVFVISDIMDIKFDKKEDKQDV